MRRGYRWISSAVILLLAVLNGCEDSATNSSDETARVRFIHCAATATDAALALESLDSDDYDILSDGIAYGNQDGYFRITAGERTFEAYLVASGAELADAEPELEDGGKYSLLLVDYEYTVYAGLAVFQDRSDPPASGKSLIRFINASSDGLTLDIQYSDGDVLKSGLSLFGGSGYKSLDAGSYTFDILDTDSEDYLIQVGPLDLTEGQVYTVILSGTIYSMPAAVFNAQIYPEINP